MAGFGETLRQARAHKNVSLKEAEQATRITRHYLAALEEEDFSSLPPIIYQRGFVRNYSIYLDLDPAQTLALFEEAHGTTGTEKPQGVIAVPPIDMPSHWAPNFAIIAFSVVLSAIVFAWVYTAYVAPPGEGNEATPPVATVTPINNDVPLPTQPRATDTPVPTATVEATATSEATQESTAGTSENASSRRTSGGDNTIEGSSGQSGDTQGGNQSEGSAAASGDNARNSDNQPEPTATIAPTPEPTAYVKVGEWDTSISVTADSDLYITFTSNGNVEFDGNLSAGDTIGPFPGSQFQVYTSSGVNTIFTNACGDVFPMGYEEGEANYELNASAESCPPDLGQ
jgi:cytoskeletal protein RodZ